MRLLFITGTPANVREGSGTWTGIATLAEALRGLGHRVDLHAIEPGEVDYASRRTAFNSSLTSLDLSPYDTVVGFDMDGHPLAGRGGPFHVASIKGVIADEARFESGETRRSMEAQAEKEAEHCRRADRVLTSSRYSAVRLREMYGLTTMPTVVPEPIDLARWQTRLAAAPSRGPGNAFTVLCVCRLYPRKRVEVLLGAAASLRKSFPALKVRIVGDGPEQERLARIHRDLGLDGVVEWLGYVSPDALAAEYRLCDLFCLPSVQEGFGIVFLEAMAAGAPIVATKAAAVPEVAVHGLLVEPDDERSLAAALERMAREPGLREKCASAGRIAVAAFDAPRVASLFLAAIDR